MHNLIKTPLESGVWLKRYNNYLNFLINVKHKIRHLFLAFNSRSILETSDSFSSIVSHIVW